MKANISLKGNQGSFLQCTNNAKRHAGETYSLKKRNNRNLDIFANDYY